MNLILDKIILNLNYPSTKIDSDTTYIADISGDDSIVALIRILEEKPSVSIIPSIIELACEYGDKNQYFDVFNKLRKVFCQETDKIYSGIVCTVNNLWKSVAACNIQESIDSFGFYSPCIACHLVLHIVRIKLAKLLKIKHVISGERESHDGKEKINQLDFVLAFYNSIYASMDIEHVLPLRYVENTEEIKQVIKNYSATSVHLDCLFSGNYYKNGTYELSMEKHQIRKYVDNYLPKMINNINTNVAVDCKVVY